ncbi:hypothetical protein [Pleomorphovibrio marinus]|uniref:hypothetical protein n=1 Tax=Pleomorphovibrio marinus TaxID=2164132 RepID=UPI000E0C83CA|nr:hypothetical protein [Pleomorphovibrio marinus]
MLQSLKNHLTNIPGWRTNRKILVIASDDWGAIRMVSKKHFEKLRKAGIRVDLSKYDSLDSLETKDDLEGLMAILGKYKNRTGLAPKFTFNTVMANPNFQKIKEVGFTKYYYRPFFQSYRDYYGQDLESLWRQAINERLIQPQFHAREHLNVSLWMRDLQLGLEKTRAAFDYDFYGAKLHTSSKFQKNYLAAYWSETSEDFSAMKEVLKEGFDLFKNVFGFNSQSFIAANYIYPKLLEGYLKALGVDIIQIQRGQIGPLIDQEKTNLYRHYMGEKNTFCQIYLVRNVLFEPYLNQEQDWVDKAMQQIQVAFFWKKPAIISSHRINYVSNMSIKHRDASLNKLDLLLRNIIKKWPDVTFLSSDELGQDILQSIDDCHTQQ